MWLLPRERSASEDWRLTWPYGERERGCDTVPGSGGMLGWEAGANCGIDMDRSDVGVLSSTAEEEPCCWLAWRVVIWACCWRIMLRSRFWDVVSGS